MEKTDSRSLAQLVCMAMELQIVPPMWLRRSAT
jgi:hypothetical protein